MSKALLVIDMLNDFIDERGKLFVGKAGKDIIPLIKEKITEFREKNLPIVFICDNHEKEDKEFEMFPPHCIKDSWGSSIIEDFEVREEDKIIKKRRYSAFYGTDLDLFLREKGINELFLAGVCTNICVLYTAKDARERGYSVKIFKEGVASFNEEAHKFALKEAGNTLGCEII
ncbi:cysteine hydrolase family protein [Thermovenabulum gondwanense]|uniref:Isochorismatase family protein YecD n=1 Tax=Thermovenabulum gondwanense TaxID=520767 RepID=A0A162N0T8_9FIRM|nr:isochorismatase family cysteine hydrolase [Thermovenabulum gondwanense]KYO68645.1 Isochorismatase family protein YecD [Thermovenabulum gondwanense]